MKGVSVIWKGETMKKRILALMLALTAAVACFGLCSCSSDESAIKKAISSDFDTIKNLTEADLEGVESLGLDEYGISDLDFYKAYFEDFAYSIDKVEVNGDKATATVTMTIKSVSEFGTAFADSISKLDYSELLTMTESELNKALADMVFDAVHAVKATPLDPIQVTLTKTSSGWEIDKSIASIVNTVISAS